MSEQEFIFQAVIDGDEEQMIEVKADDLAGADILQISEQLLHHLAESQSRRIEVISADQATKEYRLRINGRDVHVKLRDPVESRVHAMGFDINKNHLRLKHVSSPMPGLVLKVLVQEGEAISEGQPVIVLEAMKMENVLTAPSDGIVGKVHVQEKRNVDKGQVLVEIE